MLPKELKFEFKAVLKRLTKLGMEVLWTGRFFDIVLEKEAFKELVDMSLSSLNLSSESRRPVEACLAPYYGQTMTSDKLSNLGWRLAAGYNTFKKIGDIKNEFTPGLADHWAPLLTEEVRGGPLSKTGKVQLVLSFRILDGPYGGLAFKQYMPYRFVTAILAKDIGFPRFKGLHYLEMAGMWFVGLLVSDKWGPRLSEFSPTSASLDHNRKLRASRKMPCLRDFECVCHKCIVGYDGDNPCIRAVHRFTFDKSWCPCCEHESYFDPAADSRICVVCTGKKFRELTKKQRIGD